jgi:hypothetical protein
LIAQLKFYSPAHGILTPLPMVYQTLSYGIMNSSFGRNEGWFNLPWGGSKYNDKKLTPGILCSKICFKQSCYSFCNKKKVTFIKLVPVSYGILNPMVNWTRGRYTYDILTPGSIFLMVVELFSVQLNWVNILKLWCT